MGEKVILRQYLDRYRMTFEMKCEGLTPEQLATRSVAPSTMSLLGLVRHLARVEHHWFRRVLEGHGRISRSSTGPRRTPTSTSTAPWAPRSASPTRGSRGGARWRTPARSTSGTTTSARRTDDPYEVRGVVVHMIEEYARHAGHADLLRECIDGRTGQ